MAIISRRRFLQLGALALPGLTGVHARLIEPTRLQINEFRANNDGACRFVHFSDLHYRGDQSYAADVVETINRLKPEFACFTGDLVENHAFLPEALSFIREIKTPVYGSPGNHDYWCGGSFSDYQKAFAATGGDWLVDRTVVLRQFDLELVGMGYVGIHAFREARAARQMLLMHFPAMADHLGRKFDLILAGHSHGGQVRLPFYGPVLMPHGVGRYDLGAFETPFGSLYVNAGIGTLSSIPIRWNCRPEITIVTI